MEASMNAVAFPTGLDVPAVAVDCAGMGVWEIVTATGEWRCSPRCRSLLGVPADDDPLDALSHEERERFDEAIERALATGEYRLQLRLGQRWLCAVGRNVTSEHREPVIVGTLQDVTAQMIALEEREDRLGEVAHDLRNPLAAMRVAMQILFDGGARADMVARVDGLITAIDRMVGELVEFDRSRLGKLERSRAALADVCRSAIAEASIVHPGRHLVLDLHGEGVGEWDGGRLRQVIRNLVANALQHGEVHAPVKVSVFDFANRTVLSVENRGPAIPEELRTRVFDPFVRGPSRGPGLGLGLSIVKRIVEAHRGTVEMSSDESRTVFRVTLPKA